MKVFNVLAANKFHYINYKVCAESEEAVYEHASLLKDMQEGSDEEFKIFEENFRDECTYKIHSCEEDEDEEISCELFEGGFYMTDSGANG